MTLDDLKFWEWGWFRYDVSLLQQVLKGQEKIMATIADLTAKVTQTVGVMESALVLIQGLSQQLKDALAQNDPAAIQAVIDQLDAEDTKLAAGVTENTPPTP